MPALASPATGGEPFGLVASKSCNLSHALAAQAKEFFQKFLRVGPRPTKQISPHAVAAWRCPRFYPDKITRSTCALHWTMGQQGVEPPSYYYGMLRDKPFYQRRRRSAVATSPDFVCTRINDSRITIHELRTYSPSTKAAASRSSAA